MNDTPRLYEINTLAWLGELSRIQGKRITLGNVPSAQWDRLKRLGFDSVWLMGVWKRSREGVQQFMASPEWPQQRAHFDEILDFYIQGSEAGFNKHPESFLLVRKGKQARYIARGKDPYFPPWPDTAQLNCFNPEMRSALIGELGRIAEHCDGVRCDMAMLLLSDIFTRTWGWARTIPETTTSEFWEEVRKALPDLLLIAEAAIPRAEYPCRKSWSTTKSMSLSTDWTTNSMSGTEAT